MDTAKLWEIKECFPTSSWAIWSATFPRAGCLEENPESLFELIDRNRHRLKPDVVLLLLNPSGEPPSDYGNFHSTKRKHDDDLFRSLIDENALDGAYMTDLVADVVDPDGGNVTPDEADVSHFLVQLRALDQEAFHVLCFHHKVFHALREFFAAEAHELPHDIHSFTEDWEDRTLRFDQAWFPNHPNERTVREQLGFLSTNRIR